MSSLLFINHADLLALLDPEEVMRCIERSLLLLKTGEYSMPDRLNATFRNKSIVNMPVFTPDAVGTKILTIFPENTALHLPSIYGLMLLNDFTTGKPLTVIEGSTLTAIRTGAVGGVAIRHLAPQTATTLGVVGCGVQGYYQALYACVARGITTVRLYDSFIKDLSGFTARLKADLHHFNVTRDVQVVCCANSTEVVEQSEIVVTATTATDPVFPDTPGLFSGKCVIGIGSYQPTMREYPEELMRSGAEVYVEMDYALEETGDLSQPLASGALTRDRVRLLADVIDGTVRAGRTVFFKSVGMALYDVVVAQHFYAKCVARGAGQPVEF